MTLDPALRTLAPRVLLGLICAGALGLAGCGSSGGNGACTFANPVQTFCYDGFLDAEECTTDKDGVTSVRGFYGTFGCDEVGYAFACAGEGIWAEAEADCDSVDTAEVDCLRSEDPCE